MSKFQSDNINYQQFEISTNQEIFKSCENERKKKYKNKLLKILPFILFLLFFFLFLITYISYNKKSKEYTKLERKVMDHIFSPYHSDLIPNLKILKKLKKWIKQIILQKTGIKYQPSLRMYYKATRDGDYSFHEKTDKWEGYLLLIKDEKNNIFGGYTSKNFRGNMIAEVYYGIEKVDKTAFLFNLNKNEIYPIIDDNSQYHIYGDMEDGPVFGPYPNGDLTITSKFLSDKSSSEFPKLYNLKGEKNTKKNNLRLTNGQRKFLIKELEVFRVNLLT